MVRCTELLCCDCCCGEGCDCGDGCDCDCWWAKERKDSTKDEESGE